MHERNISDIRQFFKQGGGDLEKREYVLDFYYSCKCKVMILHLICLQKVNRKEMIRNLLQSNPTPHP